MRKLVSSPVPVLPSLVVFLLFSCRSASAFGGGALRYRSSTGQRPIVSQTCSTSPSSPNSLLMSFNPFSGLGKSVGSMISGATGSVPTDFQDTAPSWESLEAMIYERQTPEERERVSLRERGYGPTSSLATLRLFDAPEGTEPRVTLYRDHAAWCPYCEKVWLQLEEKRIPYRVEKARGIQVPLLLSSEAAGREVFSHSTCTTSGMSEVPMNCYGTKPSWFRQISPSGGVPVAKIDGRVISESSVIMQVLEEEFSSNKPLLPPANSPLAARVDPLLRLEREIFSSWFRWLTSPGTVGGASGLAFMDVADRVDSELRKGGGPYFLGKELSLVDLMYTPFLERMSASLPYFKGLRVRANPRWPNIDRWFDAMDSREVYRGAKSDYYTHCHDLPPQIGRCVVEAEAVPLKDEIDGKDGSWCLPLSPNGGLEPVGSAISEEQGRREAANRLVGNHGAVVGFALRGVGVPGVPGVSAELADPNAKPNETFRAPVDAALRHVVHALLEGQDAAKSGGLSQNNPENQVQLCMEYLRDRVGVPRDLPFAAARQLRAYLNWYSAELMAQR